MEDVQGTNFRQTWPARKAREPGFSRPTVWSMSTTAGGPYCRNVLPKPVGVLIIAFRSSRPRRDRELCAIRFHMPVTTPFHMLRTSELSV